MSVNTGKYVAEDRIEGYFNMIHYIEKIQN